MVASSATLDQGYTLQDRYDRDEGRVFITGTQALVRLLMEQRRRDRAQGLNTAGFVSGYRGSPVAGLDLALWEARGRLEQEGIRFQPGLNEALAATAVLGSQQVESEGRAKVDGVFGMWYGKGPGVDWAGDAIKHANAYGTSPRGGVLLVAGDDHGAVSSTMAHQSDQTLAAWSIPVLNPAGVADYLELGLYGWALSRFSGAWVGVKAISETVESAATVALPGLGRRFVTPDDFVVPRGGLHFRWQDPPSVAIEERLQLKLEAAEAFARANAPDRLIVEAEDAWLGIVTVGKAHGDLMEALRLLGVGDERTLRQLGVRILKVAQSFPLDGRGIRRLARGLRTLLVVEEKRPLVELQIKDLLYGQGPEVLGKKDRTGRPLLPATGELRPHRLLPALAGLITERHPELDFGPVLRRYRVETPVERDPVKRTPYFCSGCPHNSSTKVPEGSKAMAGIGCHVMATWMPERQTAGITQMGGEGANWVGLAPFVETQHVFQNLGDGTYFHSGHLAIRQAVMAGARITYKILYNDAVAMTGGQPVDGKLTVPQITRQMWNEGVRRIVVVSDEPARHGREADLAPGVEVFDRHELDRVQRELRDFPGVSVLVYDQTCAAEKRRRRKKGTFPQPARRAFINDLVCEGCGDCSKASNCLSVAPLETELGTKRAIDQSSCNVDLSCVDGFCPSFVTVEGGALVRPAGLDPSDPALAAHFAGLPEPELEHRESVYDLLVTGVGGTGVLTVGALVGMAAHLEGRGATVLDFTGLAQKGGAVLSHVRIGRAGATVTQPRIEPLDAEAVIACDLVVAAGAEALRTIRPGAARIVGNAHALPTADLIRDPSFRIDTERLARRLRQVAGQDRVDLVDADRLARAVTGDAIGANVLLLGFAWQKGLVPVSLSALERAIELNGVAVAANKQAFAWGRLAAHDPALVARLVDEALGTERRPPADFEALVAHRRGFLVAYQSEAYAAAYESFVRRVAAAERDAIGPDEPKLATAVAEGLFRLMAYKDEYEVARLFTEGRFQARLKSTFEGHPVVRFHMAPPFLARRRAGSEVPAKITLGPWMLRAMRLLAPLKVLRGTALDPFGRTAERRMERRLIGAYRAMIEEVLGELRPETLDLAVAAARSVDRVRGFGHVKAQGVERYERERDALLARIRALTQDGLPIAAE